MDTAGRLNVLQHIEPAFVAGPVILAVRCDAAAGSPARPAVRAALPRLPQRPYATVGDLWYELRDLPWRLTPLELRRARGCRRVRHAGRGGTGVTNRTISRYREGLLNC